MSKTRMRDLELAVGALGSLLERVVSADKKWSRDERKTMLAEVGMIKALVDCEHMKLGELYGKVAENKDEVDPVTARANENADVVARAAGIKEKLEPERIDGPRFFVDLPSGDAYSTDDAAEVVRMYESGQLTNVYDRQLRAQLIYQGTIYAVGAKALGYPSL